MVWSQHQGVGKNLLFECLRDIVGNAHATTIGQRDLAASFNGWAKIRIFVLGDEVSPSDRREYADQLKGAITGTTIQINEKFERPYEIENFANFVFLSNHPDALFIEAQDRRYFVCEITAQPWPQNKYRDFVAWRDNGGLAALHDALRQVDVSKFDPKAPAPQTAAKQSMVQAGMSSLDAYVFDLLASQPGTEFKGREIISLQEIVDAFALQAGIATKAPSTRAVAGALGRSGIRCPGRQISLTSGKRARVKALWNVSAWNGKPDIDWIKEYERGKP